METDIIPEDLVDEIFDVLKKGEKTYVVFKEDNEDLEDKARRIFGNDIEFTDFFDIFEKRMLKELSDSMSIFYNEPLIERLGLHELTEISYDLTKLGQSKKMLFNYALLGRRGNDGILQSIGGRRLGKSMIMLPSEHEKDAEDFVKKWDVKYSKRRVLVFEEV
ncbi:MAG: hypothetical protein M1433_02230 [Candidatus Parvarchaeota archaeon]|nr:hypothetical protein [Candidatus Parvarchaeota archaeon]